uniref:Uncharacterized protein n=1 Tax=Arion vulgaris TaxID=1028688 RepID=A0A0B7B040_9EUPU
MEEVAGELARDGEYLMGSVMRATFCKQHTTGNGDKHTISYHHMGRFVMTVEPLLTNLCQSYTLLLKSLTYVNVCVNLNNVRSY